MFHTKIYYRCSDCMVVGFTTNNAIGAITTKSRSWRVVIDTLCDNVNLSVTCGKLFVFDRYTRFLHQ